MKEPNGAKREGYMTPEEKEAKDIVARFKGDLLEAYEYAEVERQHDILMSGNSQEAAGKVNLYWVTVKEFILKQ